MQNSPLLPPAPAVAADVAAALNTDSAASASPESESFEAVLETQMKERSPDEPVPTDEQAVAAEAAPAKDGAALASLLAVIPAVAIPQGLAERSPGAADRASDASAQQVIYAEGATGRRLSDQPLLDAGRAGGGPFPSAHAHEARGAEAAEASRSFQGFLEGVGPRAEVLHPSHAPAAPKAPAESVPEQRVPVPASVGSREWSGQFTDRVTWIAQARQSSAELILNPPQLGPVEVHVSVSVEQVATLSFHAAHPAAREAIQGSLARLQEAFAGSGLQLADVFVGSGAPGSGGDRRGAAGGDGSGPARRGGVDLAAAVVASGVASAQRWGMAGRVDLFA